MHTRDKGAKLEKYAFEVLKGIDPKTRFTKNSGAVHNNGDLSNEFFQVECKLRDTESVTIDRKVWLKLSDSIRIGSSKIPLLLLENKHGEKFAVMAIGDFERIINKAYGKTQGK